MLKSNAIGGESATGGERPGARATPEPTNGQPGSFEGLPRQRYRRHFRFIGRRLTRRIGAARSPDHQKRAIKRAILPSLMFGTASGRIVERELAVSKRLLPEPSPKVAGSVCIDRLEGRSGSARKDSVGVDSSDLSSSSDTFAAELAGIMTSYAAQIAAAQLSYPAPIVRNVIKRLIDERTIAIRNLMARWIAERRKRRPRLQLPSEPKPGS